MDFPCLEVLGLSSHDESKFYKIQDKFNSRKIEMAGNASRTGSIWRVMLGNGIESWVLNSESHGIGPMKAIFRRHCPAAVVGPADRQKFRQVGRNPLRIASC